MFVTIETNGAHTIVISIPNSAAPQALTDLSNMLERNAVFIGSPNPKENAIVKPKMNIVLGSSYIFQSNTEDISLVKITHSSDNVLSSLEGENPSFKNFREPGEFWEPASPQVLASNYRQRLCYEKQISQLRDEVRSLKLQLDQADDALEEAKAPVTQESYDFVMKKQKESS